MFFPHPGLDSEIYRYRDESNWRKLLEIAEQVRHRTGNSAHLANLLIGVFCSSIHYKYPMNLSYRIGQQNTQYDLWDNHNPVHDGAQARQSWRCTSKKTLQLRITSPRLGQR